MPDGRPARAGEDAVSGACPTYGGPVCTANGRMTSAPMMQPGVAASSAAPDQWPLARSLRYILDAGLLTRVAIARCDSELRTRNLDRRDREAIVAIRERLEGIVGAQERTVRAQSRPRRAGAMDAAQRLEPQAAPSR